MALLILLFCVFTIFQDVSAFPIKGNPYKSEHCIKMTPEKEKQINAIVTRLTDFLNSITEEFEDFDIRLVKLDIESHSEDEVEEKDVQLQLTVNDCTEYEDEDSEGNIVKADVENESSEDTIVEANNGEAKSDNDSKSVDSIIEADNTSGEATTEANKTSVSCPEICSCQDKKKTKNNEEEIIITIDENKADKVNATENKDAETLWFFDMSKDKVEVSNDFNSIIFVDNGKDTGNFNDDDENNDNYKPEVMPLDLTSMRDDVYELLQNRHNKPLLVYVQKYDNKVEYIFL